MPVAVAEQKNSRDVLKWAVHPGFCYDEDTVVAGAAIAIERGESFAGRVVRGGPGAWVLVETGDTITVGTTKVAVIISDKKATADIATAGSLGKMLLLTRGPAIVSSDGLTAGGLVLTNVIAALLLIGIKTVSSLGDLAVVPNEI